LLWGEPGRGPGTFFSAARGAHFWCLCFPCRNGTAECFLCGTAERFLYGTAECFLYPTAERRPIRHSRALSYSAQQSAALYGTVGSGVPSKQPQGLKPDSSWSLVARVKELAEKLVEGRKTIPQRLKPDLQKLAQGLKPDSLRVLYGTTEQCAEKCRPELLYQGTI
jgi:hypothetical protein